MKEFTGRMLKNRQHKYSSNVALCIQALNTRMKMLYSMPLFWVSVILIAVLYFTAPLYMLNSEQMLSIAETMIQIDRQQLMIIPNYSGWHVMLCGTGSWFRLFVPVLAAFPVVTLYREESVNGFRKSVLARLSRNAYSSSYLLFAAISGAMMLTVAYILFAVLVYLYFPSYASYGGAIYETEGMLVKAVVQTAGWNMAYGAFWSVFVFSFSEIIKNRYLGLGIPFILKYLWSETAKKQEWKYMPDELLSMGREFAGSIVIFFVVLAVLLITVYKTTFYLRRDCSEQ